MKWYRKNLGDWETATRGLSMAEDGAYDRLLSYYYATEGGIPADRVEAIYRICGAVTNKDFLLVDNLLPHFFTLENGFWRNAHADAEISRYLKVCEKKSEGGKIGARRSLITRAALTQGNAGAYPLLRARATEPRTNEEYSIPLLSGKSPTPEEVDARKKRRQGAAQLAWKVIKYLNEQAGTRYTGSRGHIQLLVQRIVIDGATEEELRAVIDAKAKEWGQDDKMRKYLSPDTLFDMTKYAKYVGQLGMAARAPLAKAAAVQTVMVLGYPPDYQLGKTITSHTLPPGFDAEMIAKATANSHARILALLKAKDIGVMCEGKILARFSLAELQAAQS